MLKVLVVEDDKYLSSAYRVKLAKANFDVATVGDGEAALSYLKSAIPDIIILDLVMPHEDGFTVLTEIKSNDNYKNIPVIVASNLGQKEDMDKAYKLGAIDYIVKSQLTLNDIIERIMDAINKHSGQQTST